MENPNVANITYKCKKIGITFETWPTICLSLVNERQTHVGWIVIVGQKVWKNVRVNNTLPKRSPCCILQSNETLGSSCQKACEKYSGDGHA